MARAGRVSLVFAIALATGCTFPIDFGEGRVACDSSGVCPPGYHCSDKRCYRLGGPDQLSSVADLALSTPRDLASAPDFGPCLSSCANSCSPCCQQSCSGQNQCEVDCPLSGCNCQLDCSASKKCSLNCATGSNCTGNIVSGTTTTLTCSAGSSCAFTCSGASTCELNCRGTAQCLVHCLSPAVCMVNGGCKAMLTCPDNTLVCNRACP